MTVPFAAAALESALVGPLVLALPKGRILAECRDLLARALPDRSRRRDA